jgi:hypothetical protein
MGIWERRKPGIPKIAQGRYSKLVGPIALPHPRVPIRYKVCLGPRVMLADLERHFWSGHVCFGPKRYVSMMGGLQKQIAMFSEISHVMPTLRMCKIFRQ